MCYAAAGIVYGTLKVALACRQRIPEVRLPCCWFVTLRKVDDAIHQFTPYLSKVAEEGESSDIKDKELLKLIADNSLLYTDVVTKIGLLDISQTAWTQDK